MTGQGLNKSGIRRLIENLERESRTMASPNEAVSKESHPGLSPEKVEEVRRILAIEYPILIRAIDKVIDSLKSKSILRQDELKLLLVEAVGREADKFIQAPENEMHIIEVAALIKGCAPELKEYTGPQEAQLREAKPDASPADIASVTLAVDLLHTAVNITEDTFQAAKATAAERANSKPLNKTSIRTFIEGLRTYAQVLRPTDKIENPDFDRRLIEIVYGAICDGLEAAVRVLETKKTLWRDEAKTLIDGAIHTEILKFINATENEKTVLEMSRLIKESARAGSPEGDAAIRQAEETMRQDYPDVSIVRLAGIALEAVTNGGKHKLLENTLDEFDFLASTQSARSRGQRA